MAAADPARRSPDLLLAAIVAALTGLFAVTAASFAEVQNVWVDESTQLLGSALPFDRMIAWLAGHPEPLGVPPDRMPPLVYLIDWLWFRIAGGAPLGYRLLHLAFASAGVAGLIAFAGRRYGVIAALVAGILLAASPGLIAAGVEIRAYPIFFAVTVLQLWLLDGLIRHELGWPRLAGFAVAGLAAVHIHFFGLVSSSALFAGLIAARARSRGELARAGAAWAAMLVLSAGIVPFVGGARAISGDIAGEPDATSQLVAYLPRIYGHASMLMHPWLTAAMFVAIGGLLLVAALRVVRALPDRPLRAPAGIEAALIVALASGLTVTIVAGFVVHGFSPMKPTYSIWMVPLIALLAGSACAPGDGLKRLAWPFALAAVLLLAPIDLAFARHLPWFVHGPEAAIAEQVGAASGATAIVYVDRGWPYGYFPLIRHYGRGLPQYLLAADGRLHPLTDANPFTPPVPFAALDRASRVLLVSIETHTGTDLGALAEGESDPALFQAPAAQLAGWHSEGSVVRPGLYWLRLARLERN